MDHSSASFSPLLSSLITILFLAHQPSSSSSSAVANAASTVHFPMIFAFDDSFTDTGNTQSATGPTLFTHVSNPPYGMTYFHHPTNRYSDGRLVVDFLAETLSLPFLPPYLNRSADFSHGVSFAVAGSTAIHRGFYVRNNVTINTTPQSLQTELVWFNRALVKEGCTQLGSAPCRRLMEDSLFWVGEMGANDYAYTSDLSIPPSRIQKLALKRLT